MARRRHCRLCISVGVQSFRPELLTALDRLHTSDQIPRAVELVRKHGAKLSLDLIFAAPGATLADWRSDLRTALSYSPDHVSTYGLTYEKGTPLWKDRAAGRVRSAETAVTGSETGPFVGYGCGSAMSISCVSFTSLSGSGGPINERRGGDTSLWIIKSSRSRCR